MNRETNIKLLCEQYPTFSIDKITQIYDDSFNATGVKIKTKKRSEQLFKSKTTMKLRSDFAFSRTNVLLSYDKTDSISDMLYLQYMEQSLKEMKNRWGFD